MTALDEKKVMSFLLGRWNQLVAKEKGMSGIRGNEQPELLRIDGVLKFIVEVTNKIEKGEFNDRT